MPVLAEPPTRDLPSLASHNRAPVYADDDAIVFEPDRMEFGRFYLAELNGAPYLYRRVGPGEVEVYGLADDD